MAKNETKHKSKYTKPKDEAKSHKPETRKDIKDYTAPDADGMVPNLVKGIQKLVPRNINGEVIDDVENMVPKIKDHIYKKVEEGDYSPEHARKVFEKLQIEDSDGYLDAMENGVYSIKESVNRLSESQKEKLVRMYVRNKIVKVLQEQGETPPAEETPVDDTETPTPDATPTPDDTATPDATPDATTTPDATPDATTTPETPETPDVEIDPKKAEEEKLQLVSKSPELFSDYLELKKVDMNILALVKAGMKPLLKSLASIDDKEQKQAQRMAIKAITNLKKDFGPELKDQDSEKDSEV